LPVVSAVGHEIDFTISDFVADLRAATPSAAAEILTEGFFSARPFVAEAAERLVQLSHQRVEREQDALKRLAGRLTRAHPRRRLNEKLQRLDDLQAGLLRGALAGWRVRLNECALLAQRLRLFRPSQILVQRGQALRELTRRLSPDIRRQVELLKTRLGTAIARLGLLSPESVLARGYSITMDDATGQVIRSAGEVRTRQRLRTRLHQGQVRSVVEG
jgi:exodeoxyribonuclease VII large subunit